MVVNIADVEKMINCGVFSNASKDILMSTLLDIMDKQGIEYDVQAFEDLWESVLCR